MKDPNCMLCEEPAVASLTTVFGNFLLCEEHTRSFEAEQALHTVGPTVAALKALILAGVADRGS